MKSVLLIGLGKFGKLVGEKMLSFGYEVMVVDHNEDVIDGLASVYTDAVIGDCTNVEVLKKIGVSNFDVCIVAIGEDFQASLEITSLLKDLGAKKVISKAVTDIQAKFLLKNGADEIVYPEKDMAEKLAIRCNADTIYDFVKLSDNYAIFEIDVPKAWIGKSIMDIDLRKKYKTNILAVKNASGFNPVPDPNYVFQQNDHVVLLTEQSNIAKLI